MHLSTISRTVLLPILAAYLAGCGRGPETGQIQAKVSAVPVLGGASASGGDIFPTIPAFSYQCEVEHGGTKSAPFLLNEKNYRDTRETAAYALRFSPAWHDIPTPGNFMEVRVTLKEPGAAKHPWSISRFELNQIEFSAGISIPGTGSAILICHKP